MGYAAEFQSINSHFYIPIRIKYAERQLSADFLLDTGATKCPIPLIVNKEILRLPIAGTDKNIRIAGAETTYDYLVLERLEIPNTKISAEKVETWLADDFICRHELPLEIFLQNHQGQQAHNRKVINPK